MADARWRRHSSTFAGVMAASSSAGVCYFLSRCSSLVVVVVPRGITLNKSDDGYKPKKMSNAIDITAFY